MEDEEENDQDGLVEELTPTLHQEGHGDLATTVKTIIACRNASGASSVLHGSSGSHWVFTADTNTVEEKRPGVANNPAVEGSTPRSYEHEKSNEHDDGILDETPSTTETKQMSIITPRIAWKLKLTRHQ